jgi:hypothetical protein
MVAAGRTPMRNLRPLLRWRGGIAAASLLALAVLSCNPPRVPEYIAEEFADARLTIRTISLMPAIDVRPDPFAHIEIAGQARSASKRLLARKSYLLIMDSASMATKTYSSGELAAMDVSELARLGDPASEAVLYIYVEKLEQGFRDTGPESRVTVSGVLIDRTTENAIWRDRAVGTSNMTGLFTVLTGPSTEYEAVYQALRHLFATFPKRAA